MTELTRDEIRRACEAVRWRWMAARPCAYDEIADVFRFHPDQAPSKTTPERFWTADTHALLKATGEDFEIESATFNGRRVYDCRVAGVYNPVQDDFPEAGVRAVLAWARAKEASEDPDPPG